MSNAARQFLRQGRHSEALVPPPDRRRKYRIWWLTAACLGLSAVATYYLIEFVFWPRVPTPLVGVWRVTGGPRDGVVLELRANGAFQARLSKGGEQAIVTAHVQVDDDRLLIASTNPTTGAQDIKTHRILKVSDTELHLEDPEGVKSRLVRME
jgi:hypothetical protein